MYVAPEFAIGMGISVMRCVVGLSSPILLPVGSMNHKLPLGPEVMPAAPALG